MCRSYNTFTSDRFIHSVSGTIDSCLQTGNSILVCPSPDRSIKANFIQDKDLLWLEIFSEAGVSKRELQSLHGEIYTDPSFGPLGGFDVSWNAAGTQFLYVAETLVPEANKDDCKLNLCCKGMAQYSEHLCRFSRFRGRSSRQKAPWDLSGRHTDPYYSPCRPSGAG